ncbi:hypothetical protein K7957_02865 [Sphingomonas yunnanensis]|uniref:hypothetical protein n=1 Tax=Sphingomonas yunnanensis TaxID=310400 RepID=UPI001CA72489|nr:hypothetical protein [Sphingomonas yunnanensis]MBY9061868.1 hypothetical protein [Sphingomonas yunnanensis]
MSERLGNAVILLLVLVLALAALVARRMPARTMLRYTLVWGGVFIALILVATYFT